jgi:hypothetical protein
MHLTRISQETNKQKRKIRERNMLLADEGAPKLMGHPLFYACNDYYSFATGVWRMESHFSGLHFYSIFQWLI